MQRLRRARPPGRRPRDGGDHRGRVEGGGVPADDREQRACGELLCDYESGRAGASFDECAGPG